LAVRALFKCDFCGGETDRVRRVALDRGYDRLGQRHGVRYACRACSERKEAERREVVDAPKKPS
jgi:hypothetical protein